AHGRPPTVRGIRDHPERVSARRELRARRAAAGETEGIVPREHVPNTRQQAELTALGGEEPEVETCDGDDPTPEQAPGLEREQRRRRVARPERPDGELDVLEQRRGGRAERD